VYDLIIIGAGPAGLTAALYAGRYRLKTLILEKMSVGGQIMFSSTIENFPGFPGGVSTGELVERLTKQVNDLGLNIETADALEINSNSDSASGVYTVKTEDGAFQTKTIIVATGAHWKRLGVPGEEKLIGRGISFCATCDGPLFRGKEVVVVGGGDKAIEEAIFLSSYASKVTIVHRRKHLRATEILQEKVLAIPKITFMLDSVIEEIIGQNKVEAVKVRDVLTKANCQVACQGVFVFIGIQPTTEFLKKQLETDESGFIITDNKMKTSLDGIFACGDCREKYLYQVVTACGEGATAAHSAHNYLLHTKKKGS
jgi:thioredoxin reductase (NADPH)